MSGRGIYDRILFGLKLFQDTELIIQYEMLFSILNIQHKEYSVINVKYNKYSAKNSGKRIFSKNIK